MILLGVTYITCFWPYDNTYPKALDEADGFLSVWEWYGHSTGSDFLHLINAGFYISIDFDRYIFGSGSPWIVIWIAPLERARRELFKNIFCVWVSFGIGQDMAVSWILVFFDPAFFLPTFCEPKTGSYLMIYRTVYDNFTVVWKLRTRAFKGV